MKSKSLEIPADLAESKDINPHQKLILSALSEEPQMFAGSIARRIGTRTREVKEELNNLINLNYVTSLNNQDRPAYARVKGLGFVGSKPKKEFMNNYTKYSYNINNNISNYNLAKAKLFINSSDGAYLAMEYWLLHGGRKHREGYKIYQDGIDSLIKLFEGKAFDNVPDEVIHSPIKNKLTKFTLEDFKTSIDNMNLAANDPNFLPMNKGKFKAYIKKLNLKEFIYNPFLKNSTKRSMFLEYLEPLKRLTTAIPKYKTLTEVMELLYNKSDLPKIENKDLLTISSNRYGDIITKHEEALIHRQYRESKAQVIEIFIDFLHKHIYNFKPNHLISDWLYDRLEKHLDDMGLLME